jgi:hypothetical protein
VTQESTNPVRRATLGGIPESTSPVQWATLGRILESTNPVRREIGEVSAANEDYETRATYKFSGKLEKVSIDEDVRNLQNDGFVKSSRYKARKN